mmetsp:Transcript_7101/g.9382  ORF Transcript_7101/g.9382 Transcript_7101/m.9382 type:complete len:216 (-) Transcript_7101:689-1336(-)
MINLERIAICFVLLCIGKVGCFTTEYHNSIKKIDICSTTGKPSYDLYEAVRYIDRNALKLYPDEESKEKLWERSYGSWKLQLATGGGRFTEFKPVPIFVFAMLDETNFGNGVGFNKNNLILSLLGPHELITQRRQMVINVDDIFLFANKVTDNTPNFIKNGMGLGKRPIDYKNEGKRPPAFTFIAASDKSLVARGGSGGIAIWTRLEDDIREKAY